MVIIMKYAEKSYNELKNTKQDMEIELNKTQRRVFDYLTQYGSITTLQAFVDLGESRLSARIYELKNHTKCGALYFKVYAKKVTGTGYWHVFSTKGISGGSDDLVEMLLYITPEDYTPERNDKIGALDPFSGKLFTTPQDDPCLLRVLPW